MHDRENMYPDEGGFLLKFNGKEIKRCYSVGFNYDKWEYMINGDTKELPDDVKTISVEIEHP